MSNVFFNPVINKRNFERMFGEFPANINQHCGSYPRVDIVESDNSFELFAELPGLTKEDVRIVIEDGILTLSGDKKNNIDEKEGKEITRNERVFGKFERKFRLTDDINQDGIKANFENGLLKITFTKLVPEKPKEKIIEVN